MRRAAQRNDRVGCPTEKVGLPGFTIVGLTDGAIQEARERVKPAIRNAGFKFRQRRVTVNLAPEELPKEGTGFDLTSRVPVTPVGAAVSDHVWKVEEIVALLAGYR